MYDCLTRIHARPEPWGFYTSAMLWTEPHIARHMLSYHLNPTADAASNNHAFIQNAVDWLTIRFSIDENASIADFGCGPGLYTLRLARTGARVTGIDFSENSLRYARERAEEEGLDIDYTQQNYLDYETDRRFDLITMIMRDFSALDPAQRAGMLKKFKRLLKPNGALVLDVDTHQEFLRKQETATCEHNHMDGFWSADDYYTFVNTFKYDREKVILNKYTVIEASRTRTIYVWQQTYSQESLSREFTENGFEIMEWYADVSGRAYDEQSKVMAVVARGM